MNSKNSYRNIKNELNIDHIAIEERNVRLNGIRVGIFTNELGNRFSSEGIGYCVEDLGFLLASRGADVTLLYLGNGKLSGKILTSLAYNGIEFVNLNYTETKIESPPYTMNKSFYALLHLMKVENTMPYDLVHFNDYLGHGMFTLFAKRQGWLLSRTKVLVTLYGISNWKRLGNKELLKNTKDISIDYFEKQAIADADIVVAPSRFIAEYILSRGIDMKKVVHLPNPPPRYLEKHLNSYTSSLNWKKRI